MEKKGFQSEEYPELSGSEDQSSGSDYRPSDEGEFGTLPSPKGSDLIPDSDSELEQTMGVVRRKLFGMPTKRKQKMPNSSSKTQSTGQPKTKARGPRNKFPCVLGCKRSYSNLPEHYRSKKHGLSSEQSRKLGRISAKGPRTKAGNIRKVCSCCGSVTSRLADHLRRQHKELSRVERIRAIGRSEVFKTDSKNRARSSSKQTDQRKNKKEVGIIEIPPTSPPSSPPTSSDKDENENRRRTYFSSAVLSKGSTKVYLWFVKQFYLWLLTAVGGGRTEEFARQSAQQVQDFFSATGGQSISSINATTVGKFVDDNEKKTGKGRKRAATMLQYVTALLRLLLWAVQTRHIVHEKYMRIKSALDNICAKLRRDGRQEKATKKLHMYRNRLPAAIRSFFLNSSWAQHVRQRIARACSVREVSLRDLLDFRNYLLMSLTLWNGSRPMPLRLLTLDDIRQADIQTAPGEGPAMSRIYRVVDVSKHKTAGAWGAAHLSMTTTLYDELLVYAKLVVSMYRLTIYEPIFRLEKGDPMKAATNVNKAIQAAWRDCGGRVTFPSQFNCTQNRRLMTTAVRNKDPSKAALIAAQLCHSVAVADSIYAFEQSKQMGTNAVHLAMEALNEEASREDVHRQAGPSGMSLDVPEKKERSLSPPRRTSHGTITYSLLPAATHPFLEQLSEILGRLTWSDIQIQANYWGLHGGLQRLSTTTSVILIVEDFQALVSRLFDRSLMEIILSHAAVPTTTSDDVRLAFLLLTIGQIAEAFGCNVNCMDRPASPYQPTSLSAMYELAGLEANEEVREEARNLTMLPGEATVLEEEEITDAAKKAKLICKDVVVRIERLKTSMNETATRTTAHPKRAQSLPKDLESVLRVKFYQDLEASYPSVSHIAFNRVRQEMGEIRELFPQVTEQQVRDKLYTITKQESKKRGFAGKGKEAGKKTKK